MITKNGINIKKMLKAKFEITGEKYFMIFLYGFLSGICFMFMYMLIAFVS